MDTKPITLNPRSKNITEGKSRAPNRSMYYAMGYEAGDFGKPETLLHCSRFLHSADRTFNGHNPGKTHS